jgi:hypothetical protein
VRASSSRSMGPEPRARGRGDRVPC